MLFGDKERIKFNNYSGLWVNEEALVAGVGTVGVLALVGVYLSGTMIEPVTDRLTYLLVALFTGSATGHYLGVATEKVGRTLRSYLLGFCASLTLVMLGVFQASLLTPLMLLTLFTVFLVHNSGMVVQNGWIDRVTSVFAGRISLFGLVTLASYHYLIPAASAAFDVLYYSTGLIAVV
jgi:hypothetical protein